MPIDESGFSNFIIDANMVPYPAYTCAGAAGCC